jgi:hypothetical protein
MEIAGRDLATLEESGDNTPLRKLATALLYWRKRDASGLDDYLQGIEPDLLEPGPRAILASLLHRTGKEREAFRISEKIPASLLLPEEQAWLTP